MIALAAFVSLFTLPAPSSAQDYAAIVAAPDRADADRQTDQRRDPVKLLAFTGVKSGMTVLDMGAGGGYSTELMARAVGPERQGLWPGFRDQRPRQGALRGAHEDRRHEERRRAGAPVRRSAAGGRGQRRSHHVLLFLPRHHLHGGRSRRDEQEAVRARSSPAGSWSSPTIRPSPAPAPRSARPCTGSRRARSEARSRRPASSSSAAAISSAIRRTRATSGSSSPRCRSTSSC